MNIITSLTVENWRYIVDELKRVDNPVNKTYNIYEAVQLVMKCFPEGSYIMIDCLLGEFSRDFPEVFNFLNECWSCVKKINPCYFLAVKCHSGLLEDFKGMVIDYDSENQVIGSIVIADLDEPLDEPPLFEQFLDELLQNGPMPVIKFLNEVFTRDCFNAEYAQLIGRFFAFKESLPDSVRKSGEFFVMKTDTAAQPGFVKCEFYVSSDEDPVIVAEKATVH